MFFFKKKEKNKGYSIAQAELEAAQAHELLYKERWAAQDLWIKAQKAEQAGVITDAADYYSQAIKACPPGDNLLYLIGNNLGRMYEKAGLAEDAIATYEELLLTDFAVERLKIIFRKQAKEAKKQKDWQGVIDSINKILSICHLQQKAYLEGADDEHKKSKFMHNFKLTNVGTIYKFSYFNDGSPPNMKESDIKMLMDASMNN